MVDILYEKNILGILDDEARQLGIKDPDGMWNWVEEQYLQREKRRLCPHYVEYIETKVSCNECGNTKKSLGTWVCVECGKVFTEVELLAP
jgi:tRNA(Ile2) C34 agmatinyltransferase TiaS